MYFGSCSTADAAEDEKLASPPELRAVLQRFKRITHARAACGYLNDVDFEEAAAFEVLLLGWIAAYPSRLYALRKVREDYPDLTKILGFVSRQDPPRSGQRGR